MTSTGPEGEKIKTLRGFCVVAALSGLAGCVLPPVVTVVSLALDGMSVVATGKTVSDHALSAMIEQDCALVRILTEQKLSAVCRIEGATVIAAAEDVTPVAPKPAVATFAGADIIGRRTELPAAAVSSLAVPPERSPTRSDTRVADGSADAAAKPPTATLKPGDDLALAIAGPGRAPEWPFHTFGWLTLAAWDPATATDGPFALSLPADSAKGRENRRATYVVAGSFRLAEQAERLAGQLDGFTTGISLGIVNGDVYFRVVTGPYEGDEIDTARARLLAVGIADAWAINLCTADLSAPPCEPPSTPARRAEPLTVAVANH